MPTPDLHRKSSRWLYEQASVSCLALSRHLSGACSICATGRL